MRTLLALAFMALALDLSAAELSGTLRLFAGGKPLRAFESTEAVVYFRPDQPVAITPATEPVVMTTRRKQFVPRVLAIPMGTSVRFPNEDPILHNAFSTSAENAFDTGQYGRGDGKAVTFNKPGLVRVYCNVHHSMFGFLLVLDTPFHVRPDANGRFALTGLPVGGGELVVYHDRGDPLRTRVVIEESKPSALELRLDLNKRRVPNHTNKFGKPYSRTPDGNY